MIKLTIILFSVILTFFTSGCSSIDNDDNKLKIDYSFVGYGNANECWKDSAAKSLFIRIELTNNSKDTLLPWIMNCSWMDNFIIEPDNYYFCYYGCDRNFLEQFNIGPHQKIVFNGIISTDKSKLNFNDSIRIGFIQMYGNRRDTLFWKSKMDTLWNRYKNKNTDCWSKFRKIENINNKYIIK